MQEVQLSMDDIPHVSLDGLERLHDLLRGQKGAWRRAVRGVCALQNAGLKPQITTVFHRGNFGEMEAMYAFLCSLRIESWRPINIEPIGRACESRDLLLSPAQLHALLSFIREKRFDLLLVSRTGCLLAFLHTDAGNTAAEHTGKLRYILKSFFLKW